MEPHKQDTRQLAILVDNPRGEQGSCRDSTLGYTRQSKFTVVSKQDYRSYCLVVRTFGFDNILHPKSPGSNPGRTSLFAIFS